MKRVLRDVVRDHAWSYSVYLKLALGRNLRLPDSNTDCHLTGFPRSANTYSHYLAKGVFPDLVFVTHVHTIASLRQAMKYGVPVAIILRDPADCTVSMCLKYKKAAADTSAINGYLYDYWHYHEWIEKHLPNAAFFKFEDVTKKPDEFMTALASFLLIDVDQTELAAKVDEIKKMFAAREALKDPDGSSLPQESRTERKDDFLVAIRKNVELNDAKSIYQRLLKKVVPSPMQRD